MLHLIDHLIDEPLSYAAATPLTPHCLVTAENLAYLLWREMEVNERQRSVLDMIHVVMYVV